MSILADLQGNQEWLAIIKAAREMKPDLPKWTPEMQTATAKDEWIYRSGMQDGFDLCLQIFAPLRAK